MGSLGSIWLYQEDAENLKQKLQSTRLELEAARLEVSVAKEQTREKELQLHTLLQMAYQERDEAREQLHNILNKINPAPNLSTAHPQHHLMMIPNINNNNLITSDESNLFLKQQQQLVNPRANSSITESNTLSDPHNNNLNNNNSYLSSSPVDSVFDAVTSPEFSTLNNNNMGESGNNDVGFVNHQTHSTMLDHGSVVIDRLVKGKVLPQKGKLLEAVMEAGPLLQTLMLAGPLPRWRNPPPLQPFKIPQVAAMITGTTSDYPSFGPMRPAWSTGSSCSTPFVEMSCGSSSHMGVNSMLNFGNGGGNADSGRLVSPALMMMNMNMNNQIAVGKRQRLM
uniref:Uncharacterized protein n=1 Tax=Kalanchoe fedtschenkoi TaxID=63787 RepID=A0A7N0ZZG6_KALFE